MANFPAFLERCARAGGATKRGRESLLAQRRGISWTETRGMVTATQSRPQFPEGKGEVICTGGHSLPDTEELLQHPASGVLQKPVNILEFSSPKSPSTYPPDPSSTISILFVLRPRSSTTLFSDFYQSLLSLKLSRYFICRSL